MRKRRRKRSLEVVYVTCCVVCRVMVRCGDDNKLSMYASM